MGFDASDVLTLAAIPVAALASTVSGLSACVVGPQRLARHRRELGVALLMRLVMNPMIAFSLGLFLLPHHALGLLLLSLLPPGPSYVSLRVHDVDKAEIEVIVSVCTVLALAWLPFMFHVVNTAIFVVDDSSSPATPVGFPSLSSTSDVSASIRLAATMGLSIGPFGLGIALKAHKTSKFKVISAINIASGTLLAVGVVANKLAADPLGEAMGRGVGPFTIIAALGVQFLWSAASSVVAHMAFAPEDSGWRGPTTMEIQRREAVQFSCAVQNLALGVRNCPWRLPLSYGYS